MPIHRIRLRRRVYNQAARISEPLAKALGVPHRPNLLIRPCRTRAQKDLGPEARVHNMQGALKIAGDCTSLERILLVNDICTTGSTLEACTRALTAAGIREVFCCTVCVVSGDE